MAQFPTPSQPTILVAEDNAILRLDASELLMDHGYTVVEAANADEAIKLMESRKDIRMLFTDIEMPPGCDGLELAREVHNRWPNVLLLITSGRIEPTRAEIADDGTFIRKPYQVDDLLTRIDKVIEKADKAE